jgi:hypothetical protein
MSRRLSWVALGAGLLALGCGRSKPVGGDASADSRDAAEASEAPGGETFDGSNPDTADDGGGDAGYPSLPTLVPPAVDCTPYKTVSCVLHVSPGGKAMNDGLTWATALRDVQDALDRVSCGCQVWVSAGTYVPTRAADPTDPDPRAASFLLWKGSRLLGGFAGTESAENERTAGHETILSGELGDPGTRDDNAYHVVWPGDATYLDRVTVSGGHANGFNVGQGLGAGVFMVGAVIEIRDSTVSDNDAGSGGGLWADEASHFQVTRGTFARNLADVGGGIATSSADATIEGTRFVENVGVFVGGGVASTGQVWIRNATFTRNRGDFGACVALSAGHGEISQSWFEGNVAGLFGGAVFLRLGATGHLTNSVVVASSSVGHGGALTVWTASLDVDTTTIVDSSAAFGGAVVVKDGAQLSLSKSILWRNSDDAGKTFFFDGMASQTTVDQCDLPVAEVPGSTASFDADPQLANVPLATRFAESKGTRADQITLAQADQHFTVGDRIELGDDGVERTVTEVTAGTITFTPAWATETPRWLRVDRWAKSAPSLKLDLTPAAGSPAKNLGASLSAPAP